MVTHKHAKNKNAHAKNKNAHKKDPHSFAKDKEKHKKTPHPFSKGNDIPLLTLALLEEMRALVKANNRSKQSNIMVVCQIYKESSFNKNATHPGSSARGLMQLLKFPVQQLFQNHYEDEHGTIKTKELLKKVHKQGEVFHDSEKMFDAATNIQYGTEYLQYLIDEYGVSAGYQKYRGPEEHDYYSKIRACAVELEKHPNSLEALIKMNKK